MKLKETVEMMNSENYQERFRAEYKQLVIRVNDLADMLLKHHGGELDFTPKCSSELLRTQLLLMETYMSILSERARIENIDLN